MGGHAVRHYGVDRATLDYDFHVALGPEEWAGLAKLLRTASGLRDLVEGPSWRPGAYRRFVIGRLSDGREERLAFWRHNHLLAPFDALFARREVAEYGGARIDFLGLADLIRSKETEREDDWRDVRLLEEIADERLLASASDGAAIATALASLRSRKGFELAIERSLYGDRALVENAARQVTHALPAALIAPLSDPECFPVPEDQRALMAPFIRALSAAPFASARHLALSEAIRRVYQTRAREADRIDKEKAVAAR